MYMNEQSIKIFTEQSNHSVQLIFDLYTPRPHFIITHTKQFRKANVTENEIKDVLEMITDFLIEKPEFDTNAILSFHRGQWYKNNLKHFHAHLCVPKKSYCRAVKQMITPEKCSNSCPSAEVYLNHLENYLISSKLKYNRFQNQCLSMAYHYFNDSILNYISLDQFTSSKFTVAFLASSPRIGVIAKKKNLELKNLYYFMENFYSTARKKLSLINPLFYTFGAHLCLYCGGKKKKNVQVVERSDRIFFNAIQLIKSERLVGYIQIDENLYLRWLPPFLRRIWIDEFRKTQHFVHT